MPVNPKPIVELVTALALDLGKAFGSTFHYKEERDTALTQNLVGLTSYLTTQIFPHLAPYLEAALNEENQTYPLSKFWCFTTKDRKAFNK